MLLPERMCRMDCLVSKEFKDSLVSKLHSEGVVEIEFLEDSFLGEKAIGRDVPPQRVSMVSDLIIRVKKAVDFLSVYKEKNTGFVEDLLGIDKTERLLVRELSFHELLEYARDVINPAENSLGSLQSRLHEIDLKTSELKTLLDKYLPFRGLGLHSKYFEESPYLHTTIGLIPSEGVALLEEGILSKLGECFLLVKAAESADSSILVILALREDSEVLEDLLRRSRFNKLSIDVSGKFDDVLLNAESELKKLSEEKIVIENSSKKLCEEYYLRLLAVVELLEIEKQRCEVFISCGSTESITFMRFWTAQKNSRKVEEIVKRQTKNHCAIKKKTDFDDAPVLLDNPSWVKPFEGLTTMFSTPKYNQIDPTILLAPTFVLFFGMMLSDFVYGAILLLVAYLFHRKYSVYSDSIKDFSIILTYFGFSSMFFGLLTGSFLGDFVGKYLFGSEKGSQAIALWLDPLYNGHMLVYLQLVFSIGFIHILLGYSSGAFDALRRRQYKTAFLDYITLMILPIGLIVYAINGSSAGLLISAASLILIFIGSGIMGLYIKVSGILGSVVSYARLLALMVSSSGIAMTVNFLSYLSLSIPYFGIILAPLIFIAGHTVNLALNMLGSFVHTLRLHYVEFFGTFYEGGGVEFTPFMESRRYSRLIEREVK